MGRGRRPVIPPNELGEILENYRDKIFDKGRIKGKSDDVWTAISEEIYKKTGQRKTALAIYTHVTCRKVFSQQESENNVVRNPDLESSVESEANTSANENTRVVQIHFTQKKFEEMTGVKEYNDRKAKSRKRHYSVFLEGKWEVAMTEQLWDECRISCGFQFSRGRVNQDNTAAITGQCKCGITIECGIADTKRDIVVVTCILSGASNGNCSKRPLRNPHRDEIAQRMVRTDEAGTKIYKEKASELMSFGDKIPPHLYEPQVLADAKYKYLKKARHDPDPLTSLLVMKSGPYQNAIHDVGVHPFYVHYVSSNQLHVYIEYVQMHKNATIVVDATGSVVRKVVRPDGTISGSIFLYAIVIHWNGQIMVNQMLSEVHDALHIGNWFRHFLSIGAPAPKEIVSDDGKAIIIAGIQSFTIYKTITEYANACFLKKEVPCYIRMDNAHFIKNYANLLKDCQPAVKKLLLAGVGRLILARSLNAAGDILKNIFVVCMSSSSGNLDDGTKTECCKSIEFLKSLLSNEDGLEKATKEPDVNNGLNVNNDVLNEDEVTTIEMSDEEYFGDGRNLYYEWAKNIYQEAQEIIDVEIGCDPNPYEVRQLAHKLLRDCKQLPLWANVVRDEVFGYGRVPATSSIVESEFNNLKTRTLNRKVGLRVDDFVKKHLDDISGATVTTAAKVTAAEGINRRLSVNSDREDQEATASSAICPLCRDGSTPTAHFCIVCRKPVHIIFGCSEPLTKDDEGYGQGRICRNCGERGPTAIEEILSSRETEKWGGLTNKENEPPKKKVKTSYYMGAPFLPQDLQIRRSRTEWPILKNSSCLNLKPHTIENMKVSLSFTCAFDAISQVLLRLMDEPQLKTLISSWGSEYSEFLNELHDKGITSNTYRRRAAILMKVVPTNKISVLGTVHNVACDIVAAELVSLLLTANPFALCNAACGACDYKNTVAFKTVSIADTEINRLGDAVGAVFTVKETPCLEPCAGYRRAETSINSPIMIIDIYETQMDLKRINIDDISKSIYISSIGRHYQLMGVVIYEIAAGSRTRTVKELADTVQHYTALVFNNDSWILIDDMKGKTKRVKKQISVVPAVLIYAQLD